MRAACAVVLVGLLATLAFAADAKSYRLGGKRWPTKVIGVFDRSGHRWSVAQAVRAINASGANVRLTLVRRSRAQIVVRAGSSSLCGKGSAGCASSLGYNPWGPSWVAIVQRLDRFDTARLVTHELLHVLGLGHEGRWCSIMNQRWDLCHGGERGRQWRCRLLEQDDIRALVTLYGGKAHRPRTPALCDAAP